MTNSSKRSTTRLLRRLRKRRIVKALAHVAFIACLSAVLFGVPFVAFANVGAMVSDGVDTVSSATIIQDAPSGDFAIYINRDKHPDERVLGDWVAFFSGEETPLIMEDISCVVLSGDVAGIDMAESLRSRLPENQMSLRVEEAALALSKAEQGLFDVLAVSEEMRQACFAYTLEELPFVEAVFR